MVFQNISYYRIIQDLSTGGMGEVYLTEGSRFDRKVALKLLPRQADDDMATAQI